MSFGDVVRDADALVVQPRMGLAGPVQMRAGLAATKAAAARTVGTITLDSYTRVRDLAAAERALRAGHELNGYPLVNHDVEVTRRMLTGIADDTFPVQVRHGSAEPSHVVTALLAAGLHATEGGPVSYCLPYGRVPLSAAVRDWAAACDLLARAGETGPQPHVESFGGCMLGQLCPPALLVAITVLEALFFRSRGIRSISVSYAQQTHAAQDMEAIRALRTLCTELLPDVDWHVVVYTYMGLYPRTAAGARELLAAAARLAVAAGARRLIVKTVAEAHRIPTVPENVAALELAAAVAARQPRSASTGPEHGELYHEAYALIDAVLNLDADPGQALLAAFGRGLLDVPYCLHPDNAGSSRGVLDDSGRLRWAEVGAMPLRRTARGRGPSGTASGLLADLSHVRRTFDAVAFPRARTAHILHPETKPRRSDRSVP